MRKRILRDRAAGPPGLAAASGGVQSVRRALHILRLLAEERRSLGITEIADETGLPQATVHRLLATLLESGWVDQSPHTARYRLGHGILGSAAIALAHAPLLERGRPFLTRVTELSGLSAYLSVLVGRRVTFLARGTAHNGKHDDFHAGITQPAHCTAAGKALLAHLPAEQLRGLYKDARVLRRYTERTITDLASLRNELNATAARGYATDSGEFNERYRSVAVPVRDDTGAVIAALSCGGFEDSWAPRLMEQMRGEMVVLADELSLQLGLSEE